MANLTSFINDLTNLISNFANGVQNEQRDILEDIANLQKNFVENSKQIDAVAEALSVSCEVLETMSINNSDIASSFKKSPDVIDYDKAIQINALEDDENYGEADNGEIDE